jgi:multimeric flavodoxin WrbA
MNTLIVSGSIRSRESHAQYIIESASSSENLDQYISDIRSYQELGRAISNSDILAGAVSLAMKLEGATADFFPLIKLFPKREQKISYGNNEQEREIAAKDTLALNEQHFIDLKNKINNATGIVLVTPVYFGDRSSVANKLLQLSGIHNLIEDKVFGAVSVGAKRNGGQETTIIYSLFEALNQNAMIVGNGPPTSQYGGTGVGGRKGTVIDDLWGLETAYGTGARVTQVSKLLEAGKKTTFKGPVEILVLVTMDDTSQSLYKYMQQFLSRAEKRLSNTKFKLVNVLDKTIHRCIGCEKCPAKGLLDVGETPCIANHAHCIISEPDDAMENIHEQMLQANGIIIAGLNVKHHDQLVYRYQALMERTRYIRRNHFELTNKLMTSFSLTQVGAKINSLHAMKTVTSYIRHNSIMHKPIESYIVDNAIIEEGIEDLIHFVKYAEIFRAGADVTDIKAPQYTTKGIGGY